MRLGPKLSAAIVVIDNPTGEVRARVGAADYLDGRLSVSFGTIAKTSTTPATPYMLVHGN